MADRHQANRSSLLSERLKRKETSRKRVKNDENSQQLRSSAAWRPAGNSKTVAQQQRCAAPLTSSFSVGESLRNSRVLKGAAGQAASKQSGPVAPQPGRSCEQQQTSRPKIDERRVLQPVGTLTSGGSGCSSAASSCANNGGGGAARSTAGSRRTSLNSLNSAINLCSSPTVDDGPRHSSPMQQHGQQPHPKQAQSLQQDHQQLEQQPQEQEDQHQQQQHQKYQQHQEYQLPQQQAQPHAQHHHQHLEQPTALGLAGDATALHILQLADSCCELLALLQMDDSPTASSRSRSRCSSSSSIKNSPQDTTLCSAAGRISCAGTELQLLVSAENTSPASQRSADSPCSAPCHSSPTSNTAAAAAAAPVPVQAENEAGVTVVGQPAAHLHLQQQQSQHHQQSQQLQASSLQDRLQALMQQRQQLADMLGKLQLRPRQRQQQHQEDSSLGQVAASGTTQGPCTQGWQVPQQPLPEDQLGSLVVAAEQEVCTHQQQQQEAEPGACAAKAQLPQDGCCSDLPQQQHPEHQQEAGSTDTHLQQQLQWQEQQQHEQQQQVQDLEHPSAQPSWQQPAPRRPCSAVNSARIQQQLQQMQVRLQREQDSQQSSYQRLFAGTKALMANSNAAAQHLQRFGPSPLKLSSPSKLFGGAPLSRTHSGGWCGSSPGGGGGGLSSRHQLSRLSTQSWAGASPEHTPRAQPQPAWGAQQATGAAGEAVRTRLFGPAPPYADSPVHSAQAAQHPMGLQLPHPAFARCSSDGAGGGNSSNSSRDQQCGNSNSTGSPAAAHQNHLLHTSRVAQVLFGSHTQQHHQENSLHAVPHSAAALSPAAPGAAGRTPAGTASRRYAAAAPSRQQPGSPSNEEVASDDDGSCLDGVSDDGEAGEQATRTRDQNTARKQSTYTQQQVGALEWTVHTNWVAADLDAQSSAVAAAAAAAADLSAQLGHGQPVMLQDHRSPFAPPLAAASGGGHSGGGGGGGATSQAELAGAAVGGASPMWLSKGMSASPVCLLAPKTLWE